MIRHLAILIVVAVCLTTSTSAEIVNETDIAKAQKIIFKLAFSRFDIKKVYPEIYQKGQEWDFEAKLDSFDPKYQVVVKDFLARHKSGLLPPGRLFSIYYPHLVDDTIAIFNLFYYAPDLWTFIYVSAWAGIHLNENQFIYALSSALIQRPDTKYIPLPRPYQVYPEYFFNTEVITKLRDYQFSISKIGDKIDENQVHVIDANYSNCYITNTPDHEYKLTYFREDIGLNAWYYYFKHRYPFWMSKDKYPNMPIGEHGEMYYYVYKSLENRYYLERLSNGLGEIELINWDKPIAVGYSPHMTYRNGLHFPRRPDGSTVSVQKNEYVEKLKEYESRISKAVDSGYVLTSGGELKNIRNERGLNVVGNLIQGNHESLNKDFYGSIDIVGRHVLGFSPVPRSDQEILPSALEQTLTSMRDPGFYRLYNKISYYFAKYKEHLGSYTPAKVGFEDVTIESANIVENQLFTYFENIETPIYKFSHVNDQYTSVVKARQYRLNHKPFAYNIIVNSLKDVKASVRIFIGPKYNVYGEEVSDKFKNFYEIDYFVISLTEGKNTIERNSTDSYRFTSEYDSEVTQTFEKYPEELLEHLLHDQRRFAFPAHLLLPKGTAEGFPIQFFVCITEFIQLSGHKQDHLLGGRDDKPIGFPLDRPIYNFTAPNLRFMDVLIYHKDEAFIRQTTQ